MWPFRKPRGVCPTMSFSQVVRAVASTIWMDLERERVLRLMDKAVPDVTSGMVLATASSPEQVHDAIEKVVRQAHAKAHPAPESRA